MKTKSQTHYTEWEAMMLEERDSRLFRFKCECGRVVSVDFMTAPPQIQCECGVKYTHNFKN